MTDYYTRCGAEDARTDIDDGILKCCKCNKAITGRYDSIGWHAVACEPCLKTAYICKATVRRAKRKEPGYDFAHEHISLFVRTGRFGATRSSCMNCGSASCITDNSKGDLSWQDFQKKVMGDDI